MSWDNVCGRRCAGRDRLPTGTASPGARSEGGGEAGWTAQAGNSPPARIALGSRHRHSPPLTHRPPPPILLLYLLSSTSPPPPPRPDCTPPSSSPYLLLPLQTWWPAASVPPTSPPAWASAACTSPASLGESGSGRVRRHVSAGYAVWVSRVGTLANSGPRPSHWGAGEGDAPLRCANLTLHTAS